MKSLKVATAFSGWFGSVELTLKYLDYLEEKLDIKIIRIESDGMEAISKRKKMMPNRMMPNRMMRFCTENLKIKPAIEFYKTFQDKDIDYHKEHGIYVNPLYKKGFTRVWCYPCIYARKHELQMMETKYVQRLRNLENDMKKIVFKDGHEESKCTFFQPDRDMHLRETLDFGDEFANQCVNQYWICE